MALSEVMICNWGLFALGEEPILSLTQPNSKPARLCNAGYATARDAVTRRVRWNCARWRAALAADPTPPPFEWSNRYTLPSDFIRMVDEPDIDAANWAIEGDRLLSNDGPPFDLLYIRRMDDVTLIDPLMGIAIGLTLAAAIGRPLAQDEGIITRCMQQAENAIRTGASVSAGENSVREWDVDMWLRARF